VPVAAIVISFVLFVATMVVVIPPIFRRLEK
jgi:hypothetical protein